jgi:hypothetical protein
MTVLRVPNKRLAYKLVGASLPPQIHNYLNLYALAKKTTKSTILKELFIEWIKKTKVHAPEMILVDELVERLKLEWKIKEANEGFKDYTSFLQEVSQELIYKGLNEEQIDSILLKLRQYDGKKKNRNRAT